MACYDFVFVIGYHRTAHIALALVSQLSRTKNVAVILYDEDQELHQKTGKHKQKVKLDLRGKCSLISAKTEFRTKFLIIQQFNYTSGFLDLLKASSHYDKDYILMSFASTGLANFDEVIEKFDTATLLTQDSSFLYLLSEKRNVSTIRDRIVLEIGLPEINENLSKIPVMDWIILSPTTFSLQSLSARNNFLHNAIQFIMENPSDVFVYKEHNGNHLDSLGLFILPKFIRYLMLKIPILRMLIQNLNRENSIKGKYKALFVNFLLRLDISSRVINLTQYYENAHQAAEIFIPYVGKGIIGGYSNTIWAASYHNKKYINISSKDDYLKIYESPKSRNLLGLNLKYILTEEPSGPRMALNTNKNIMKIKITKLDIVDFFLKEL